MRTIIRNVITARCAPSGAWSNAATGSGAVSVPATSDPAISRACATSALSSSAFKQHQAARPRTEPRLRCRRNKRSAPNEEEARRRIRPRKLARIGQVHNGRDGPQHRQARRRMAWPQDCDLRPGQ